MMKKILLTLALGALLAGEISAIPPGKYVLRARADLLEKSREIALGEIGTVEKSGRNDGEVMKYNAVMGWRNSRAPYCASGVYWCYAFAADALGINRREIPIPQTGLANGIFAYAKKFGKPARYSPEIDDLIVWRYRRSSRGHIERITEVNEKGWVTTVAFNTEIISDGRRLCGVFAKRRNIYHPIAKLTVRGLVGFEKIEREEL